MREGGERCKGKKKDGMKKMKEKQAEMMEEVKPDAVCDVAGRG